ncbi:saccharopine dehydrogenase family protein [Litoribrevibacter albus]|uniref:Saccharopine dehydrogenase n=1 Tax=Litoribrevibacter albus TaxID=1473156 RepID=A0AA37SA43_9GAMM|nr:saccharopine dehydrogenase NADP-binding domain-containing protein [Litoribrevibacter albus]GLQ31268.1 saccharopine dehydrogenase [Litoribrevibacter albus]
MTARRYDITLYGATGYTGRLILIYLCESLLENSALKHPVSLAIAGRDRNKLELLKQEMVEADRANEAIAVEVADCHDEEALMGLAEKTQVMISAVGPYMELGEPVIKACAEKGTDYLDITGENEFVDAMYPKYDMVARSTKCRLIHACGFDSVPHDLGVLFAVQQLSEQVGELVREDVVVDTFVNLGGRISSGTWKSMISIMSRLRHSIHPKQLWRSLVSGKFVDGRTIRIARPRMEYRSKLRSWIVPLPSIDSQVVRRSAELFEQYGRSFTYGHYLQIRSLPKLLVALGGVSTMIGLSQLPWTREKLLSLFPEGDGPSDGDRERAWFKVTVDARCGPHQVLASVRGGDPGYGETAKIVSQAALALIQDREHLEPVYGVLTPAAAFGELLIERLIASGIQFTLLDEY